MTQEEFAMRLGVTPQAVSKWERDLGLPDITMLAGICNVLELDANVLLGVKAEGEEKSGKLGWTGWSNLVAEPLELRFGKELYRTTLENLTEKTYEEMIDCVVRVCSEHYGDILNKCMVKSMVDIIKELYPGVADGLVPERIGYGELLSVLKNKLKKGENIRDLIHILDEMEAALATTAGN